MNEADKLRATIGTLAAAGGLRYADHLEFARAAGDAGAWELALEQVELAIPLITPAAVKKEYPTVKIVRPEKLEADHQRISQAAKLMRGWCLAQVGRRDEALTAFAAVEKETRYDFLGMPENALDYFTGQTLLAREEYEQALERLARGALIGGREIELSLLARAWRGLRGSAAGFAEYCDRRRRDLAPAMAEVTFTAMDDTPVNLASLRGRVILLLFWFPACSACRDELPLVEPLWRTHRERGLSVVAIDARRDREGAEAFIAEQGLSYLFLENGADEHELVGSLFGIKVFPATWLVDRRFRVRHAWDWQKEFSSGELERQITELLAEPAD